MTIRFLKAWNGNYEGSIVTLGGAEETRLTGLGLASYDLDGDNSGVHSIAEYTYDINGNVVGLSGLSLQVSVTQFGALGDNATDDLASIQEAVDYVSAIGGGIVYFPQTLSGAYKISNAILVSTSNVILFLDNNITLTKTTATSISPCSAIRIIGTSSNFISNVGVIANRPITIDCNGRNVTGYTHVPGGDSSVVDHHGILTRFTRNIVFKNIYAYNGLIGGIIVSYSLGGTIDDCSASHSVYDNGIYIYGNGEQIVAFSDIDPSTWSGVKVNRAKAWNCANHGLGIYGAVGVTYTNPKIWNCGNNTGTAGAGPAGGLGIEFDGTNATRNYRFLATDVEVSGSFGFGIRTNCRGTTIKGGFVTGVKIPTNYTDTSPAIWGSGVFIQNVTDCDVDVDIFACERVGLRVQGDTAKYPEVKYKGKIETCAERAIYGIGINDIVLDASNVYRNNGSASNTTAGSFYTIDINNAALNVNAGTAQLAGRFDNNYGGCISSSSLGVLDITKGISGINNCAAYASAFHAIYVQSVVELKASNILLSSTNSKQARVLKVDASTRAYIDRASILGDQTNAAAPKAEVVSTTFIGDMIGSATYDPANILAGAWGVTTTVTVTGAVVGNIVSVAHSTASSLLWFGSVTAANTVTIAPFNPTVAPIDLASGTLTAVVTKIYG